MPGFLRRLFRPSTTHQPSSFETAEATVYGGDETLEVVGESHYQNALWEIVGGRRAERIRCEIYAVLVPAPDNEYDENAIEVRIDGERVGFLSREDAARYHRGLLELMDGSASRLVALHGVIVGGGMRDDGHGRLGVFLDHDPVDFGLSPQVAQHTQLRTGLSQALATDLADNTYDLSWSAQLSDDDAMAVPQLRTLLEAEDDPIDRHYMLCELERRLYRCRDMIASALDEFDVVCEQHHREMNVLRPALTRKFGAVPVIDMYRQATIRCAKARRWQEAEEWAKRGVEVYGGDAARPEDVEDLRKRIAHASAKREGAQHAERREPTGARLSTAERPVAMEMLVCAACGSSYQRVRVRGRKPRLCPTCRASGGVGPSDQPEPQG